MTPENIVTWEQARQYRWWLLSQSDWTQLPDAPLTTGQKAAWSVYRQALRDIPQNFANLEDIVWPTEPE